MTDNDNFTDHRRTVTEASRSLVRLACSFVGARYLPASGGQPGYWATPKGKGQADTLRRMYVDRMRIFKPLIAFAVTGADVANIAADVEGAAITPIQNEPLHDY